MSPFGSHREHPCLSEGILTHLVMPLKSATLLLMQVRHNIPVVKKKKDSQTLEANVPLELRGHSTVIDERLEEDKKQNIKYSNLAFSWFESFRSLHFH